MPTYFFDLKTADETIRDLEGTDLPDEASARSHARLVARELMQHQPRTRSWCLAVSEGEGKPCFELMFASVDDSINHLTPELRNSVELLCANSASLAGTIATLRSTIREIKARIARSEGSPYLAAINGRALP